tara:strand:- start:1604 stop:2185 length:582 start_codon:yes stop_codon:yes gene_type:complete
MKQNMPDPTRIFTINIRGKLLRLLLLLIIAASTIAIFLFRDRLAALSQYGYLGVFLVNLIASGTILLPAPGALFTYAIGAVLNPPVVALASAAGASLGELSGYAAGVSGQAVIGNTKLYKFLYSLMQKHTKFTNLILLLAASIPNPFFDLVGMASGALRLPLFRFMSITFIGNLFKMLSIAYAGHYSLQWFIK